MLYILDEYSTSRLQDSISVCERLVSRKFGNVLQKKNKIQQCLATKIISRMISVTIVLDTRVRLVSSTGNRTDNLSSGRFEIFISNTWGTVCADGFDIHDADIACQELDFLGGNSYTSASLLG